MSLVVVEIWVNNVTSSSRTDDWISFPVFDQKTLIYSLIVDEVVWLNCKSWLKFDNIVNVVVLLRDVHLCSEVGPALVVESEVCEIVHVVVVDPLAIDG